MAEGYAVEAGGYSQPVRTASARAQRWFDRGCLWLAAYHREEAAFCFEHAARDDPGCAMALWGVALAHGPDYNFHAKNGFFDFSSQESGWPSMKTATEAISKAVQACEDGPPREKALITALAVRYQWPITAEIAGMQETYADKMESVAHEFPDDADIQAVAAEAILILQAWDLYEKPQASNTPPWHAADKVLRPLGERARVLVERGLRVAPAHIWLCHLKVHMCEMGPVDAFDMRAAEEVRRACLGWCCRQCGSAWCVRLERAR